MIGPVENYAELGVAARQMLPGDTPRPSIDAVRRDADLALARHGLVRMREELRGRYLVLPRGEQRLCLERTHLYSLAAADEVPAAVRAHVAMIADRHGPGGVWFLLDPVHIVTEGDRVLAATVIGKPGTLLVMRTIYGHEAQAR
jgi:hypothetical protein